MDRRGFLGSILTLGAAPAIVRADSLMRIVPSKTLVLTHEMIAMEFAAWHSMRMRAAELLINPPMYVSLASKLDVERCLRFTLEQPYLPRGLGTPPSTVDSIAAAGVECAGRALSTRPGDPPEMKTFTSHLPRSA